MAIHEPNNLLRVEAYYGFLGYPVGILTVSGEQALFVNYVNRKAYKTNKGSEVLEKLLKVDVAPKTIISFFTENFELDPSWKCRLTSKRKICSQKELTVDWHITKDNKKSLTVDSYKSTVTFIYEKAASGSNSFELKIPKDYRVIEI